MKRTLTWEVAKQGADAKITFEGEVNEAVRLDPLLDEVADCAGVLTMDLAGIRRLNSSGVRLWVNFMRGLAETEEVKEIVYVRCSVAIVSQINMIKDFQGAARVESIFAPYANEDTGDEDHKLLTVEDIEDPTNPPTFEDSEGGVWELDEMPERYFAFLIQK